LGNKPWLLIAKQTDRFLSVLAHFLSGENRTSQFITDAFITPETSYENLPLGTASQMPRGISVSWQYYSIFIRCSRQHLHGRRASRYQHGFCYLGAPGQGFLDSDTYAQLPSLSSSPLDNPGKAAADGSKSVKWNYKDTLLAQLKPSARNATPLLGHVVIMAIACLAVNIPARTGTAAMAVYQLSKMHPPLFSTKFPEGLDMNRLARAACEAGS
jgi:hypothetical protein